MFGHGRPHFVHPFCALLIAATAIFSAPKCAPISNSNSVWAQEVRQKSRDSDSGQGPSQRSANTAVGPESEQVTTKLRFSWGGGDPQTWRGKISTGDSGGTISSVAPLGVTLDATASVRLVGKDVEINHWSPTNYGGADLVLTGSPDTRIYFQLTSIENPQSAIKQTITIGQLNDQMVAAELDASGNRFSVSRAPGDRLGVEFEKQHLIFEPGELFRVSIQPKLTGLATKAANCRVKVVLAGSTGVGARAIYSKSVPFKLDENGSAAAPIELEIPVPKQEEVYDMMLELEPVWYQASFASKSNSIKRSVQFIVLDERLEAADPQRRWRQVSVADPADFGHSEAAAWNQIPKLGRTGRSSLGNELRSPTIVGQETLVTLGAGGWQAIPLTVGKLGEPHVVELEYVSGREIAVGLSLLQPDASGEIPLYGFDSGIFTPDSLVTRESKSSIPQTIEHHRITVWPNTKTPYLLVANRHANQSVTIGKVRVFAGPTELPARELKSTQRNSRKLMAFYESPLFAENFASLAQTDDEIAEPLDDWRMFYIGASRLIEYLKANSYRGAFITVACDGSSIYPSNYLASTPKHDNGTFFKSGQDPIRKDVLEMLFRMFEREGLTLVPSLALSSPLPEVESLRGSGAAGKVNGFDLVDLNSSVRQQAIGDGLPVYNPLDRQMQQAVTRVVQEIAERYKTQGSFGGIAIVCRPDTYSLLPGRQWGYDNLTVTEFIESQSDLTTKQLDEVRASLTSAYRKQWTQWRADRMTSWYQDMLSTVRQSVPGGTLYLAPVDLYRNQETASALSPSLHVSNDFEQVMLHVGLDLERLQNNSGISKSKPVEGIVLLNPHRVAPEESFASKRVDYTVEHSQQAKQFFGNANYKGDLFTHRIAWAHFAQLQQQSPFGTQASNLVRLQPMSPVGQFNRRRFVEAIKERDSRLLVDGGVVMTFGQEAALTDMMSVFNQLPDEPFTDVIPATARLLDDAQTSLAMNSLPIAVRQLNSPSGSYFYVANASPWPLQIRATINSDGNELSNVPEVESFSKQKLAVRRVLDKSSPSEQGAQTSGDYEVVFEIPAYGLRGGRSLTAGFSIEDFEFTLPEGADKVFKKQVYALEAKLIKANNPDPVSAIDNPGFESSGQPSLDGWDLGQQATSKIKLSSSDSIAPGQSGTGALVMSNDGNSPVWIRSNAFSGPETGRISISVWLRIDENAPQPPLRLAVEGKSKGGNYYRFGSVGSLSPDPAINQVDSQWKRFAVHFDDLPIEGLSNVRVGFDLMGPGEVQIDNVQIYDRWFDENDAKAITQILASTSPLLSKPETIDSCRRLLEGYWIEFLDRYAQTGSPNVASSSAGTSIRQADVPEEVSREPASAEEFYQPNQYEQGEVWNPEEKPRIPMFRRLRNLVPARKPQLR